MINDTAFNRNSIILIIIMICLFIMIAIFIIAVIIEYLYKPLPVVVKEEEKEPLETRRFITYHIYKGSVRREENETTYVMREGTKTVSEVASEETTHYPSGNKTVYYHR